MTGRQGNARSGAAMRHEHYNTRTMGRLRPRHQCKRLGAAAKFGALRGTFSAPASISCGNKVRLNRVHVNASQASVSVHTRFRRTHCFPPFPPFTKVGKVKQRVEEPLPLPRPRRAMAESQPRSSVSFVLRLAPEVPKSDSPLLTQALWRRGCGARRHNPLLTRRRDPHTGSQ